jgi:hypothetical protein
LIVRIAKEETTQAMKCTFQLLKEKKSSKVSAAISLGAPMHALLALLNQAKERKQWKRSDDFKAGSNIF